MSLNNIWFYNESLALWKGKPVNAFHYHADLIKKCPFQHFLALKIHFYIWYLLHFWLSWTCFVLFFSSSRWNPLYLHNIWCCCVVSFEFHYDCNWSYFIAQTTCSTKFNGRQFDNWQLWFSWYGGCNNKITCIRCGYIGHNGYRWMQRKYIWRYWFNKTNIDSEYIESK